MKRVQFPHDFLCTQTWPPIHRFVHKYGRRFIVLYTNMAADSLFCTQIWPPWRHVKTIYKVHYGRCASGVYTFLPSQPITFNNLFFWIILNLVTVLFYSYVGLIVLIKVSGIRQFRNEGKTRPSYLSRRPLGLLLRTGEEPWPSCSKLGWDWLR